jgi:hypothetical protein
MSLTRRIKRKSFPSIVRSRRPTPSYTFLGHEEEEEEETFIQELTPWTRRTPSATRKALRTNVYSKLTQNSEEEEEGLFKASAVKEEDPERDQEEEEGGGKFIWGIFKWDSFRRLCFQWDYANVYSLLTQ